MRALLVHNDAAGTDPVPRAEIEGVLGDAGMDAVYCAHSDDDLEQALADRFDLIVAAGGDGTVSDVLSTLTKVEIPVGILPLGGSNNIANSLGVDGDWRAIPSAWDLRRWRSVDRCEADGPWGREPFIEALGLGALSDAVDMAEDDPDTAAEKQANGRAAFAAALLDADPFECLVETDGWSWEGPCVMIELMNMAFVGSRLALSPDGRPDDGLLDLVLMKPEDRSPVAVWARDPDGRPFPLPSRKAPWVRLTTQGRPFRLDDRSPDERLAGMVEARIRSLQVRILTPRKGRT